MSIVGQLEERLSIFKNLYDSIRVVDPVNKESYTLNDGEFRKSNTACYEHINKNTYCENCVSMRAYVNNDTFVKLEHIGDEVSVITASPVEVDGKLLIVEMIKVLTEKNSITNNDKENRRITEELVSDINERVITDELTGIYNNSYVFERLPIDINCSIRSGLPLSLIMLNIDNLQIINRKYGQATINNLLIMVSCITKETIRERFDWASRYGDEKFLIVLNNADVDYAFSIAEKIRTQIENRKFRLEEEDINITASLGVYSPENDENDVNFLIAKINTILDEAKKNGKNRTSRG